MDFNQAVATFGNDFSIIHDGNPQPDPITHLPAGHIKWQDTIVGSDVPKGTKIFVTLSDGTDGQPQNQGGENNGG